jgi:hypothetical protein
MPLALVITIVAIGVRRAELTGITNRTGIQTDR